MAAKVICNANQKGGVGKTTTTLSLAHGLALKGKQVLVIDFDPQGQAAVALGMSPESGAYWLLAAGNTSQEQKMAQQWIRNTGRLGLMLIPGNQMTMTAQTIINADNRPVSCIRKAIEPFVRSKLDYIIYDTAPSVGGIQERAIWAADLVIIPSATDYLSTDRVRKVSETILTLKNERNWSGALDHLDASGRDLRRITGRRWGARYQGRFSAWNGAVAVCDELVMPLMGLSDGPTAYPMQLHFHSRMAHSVFGLAVALTTQMLIELTD